MQVTGKEIIAYRPWVIPQQAALGKQITASWKTYHQSSEEKLKKIYSRPDFDPSTRFYLVENNDTVVGFLTCKITGRQALVSPPIVQEDNYDYIRWLFDHALQQFKDRNIDSIRLTTSRDWGTGYDLVDHYRMQKTDFLFREYVGKISDVIGVNKNYLDGLGTEEQVELVNFDSDSHLEPVAKLLASIIGYSTDTAKSILDNPNPMKNIEQSLSYVIYFGKKVISWIRGEIVKSSARSYLSLSPGYIEKEKFEIYRNMLIQKIMSKAEDLGIRKFRLVVTASTRSQFRADQFENPDLDHEIAYYRMDLADTVN